MSVEDHRCVEEVVWKPVKLRLLSGMKSIKLFDSDTLVVPDHLAEDNIKQYELVIIFDKKILIDESINMEDIMDLSQLKWDSTDYETSICYAGSIFKRPKHKNYWVLESPCINC